MKPRLIAPLLFLPIVFCTGQERHKSSTDRNGIGVPEITQSNKKNRKRFVSFSGIDSVATSDNSIADTPIDSIAVHNIEFDALYMYCFKSTLRKENYGLLKHSDPQDYRSIMSIHTAHLISVEGQKFAFNGKGHMGCGSMPESSNVHINSTVYSLFSDRKHLGNLIILDSMERIQ